VWLPPFYAEEPDVWFVSAEAHGIAEEKIKFYYVLSLDHRYLREVRDIVISPPQQGPYKKPKTELLNGLSPSREKRTRQLLTSEEMGDRKLSQFLRRLRNLDSDVSDRVLRFIWASRLPSNVKVALARLGWIQWLSAQTISSKPSPLPRLRALPSNGQYRVPEALRRTLSQSGESQR
jgi:hypothetical protein